MSETSERTGSSDVRTPNRTFGRTDGIFAFSADGRVFEWVGERPYTRLDGTQTKLLMWVGSCAVCGDPFTVSTPQSFQGTKAFGRKHCDVHKLTREEATAKWLAVVNKARKRQ